MTSTSLGSAAKMREDAAQIVRNHSISRKRWPIFDRIAKEIEALPAPAEGDWNAALEEASMEIANLRSEIKWYIDKLEAAEATIGRLAEALKPFANAHRKTEEPIGDSDLDNEQPRSIPVTLGDLRRAARLSPPAASGGEEG